MLNTQTKTVLEQAHGDRTLGDIIDGLRDVRKNLDLNNEDYHPEHELSMLKAALQGAVTLEFATVPPYLSAIWSIKDNLHPVAKSLREILQEEMLHMALACNLLTSVGGKPEINTAVPVYPGKLPLGVHPELTIPLGGLNGTALEMFMEIERPHHPGHFLSLEAIQEETQIAHNVGAEMSRDFTIGELYDGILHAFERIKPEFSVNRQITGPLAWFVVKSFDDVKKAVHTIQTQGEGSVGSPDSSPENHAHYYRFAEILEQKKLVLNETTGKWSYDTPIDFDMAKDVWLVGRVPEGGYSDDIVPDPEVRRLLRGFNLTYSKLLDQLDSVWEREGGQANFWRSLETMFALEGFARPLMQKERPDGMMYGPDWRYIPKEER